ncbi:LPS-assembly protein LptD [Fodinicurvata halophila]|uniref:LPS-assembly protein LptD n=1 Tax=Fodinicurvata halophila TaxID=1419723 RepID=A0ABV8ULN8_9PROT
MNSGTLKDILFSGAAVLALLTPFMIESASPVAAQTGSSPANTEEEERDERALLRADEVTNNEDEGIITASGNVELAQGDRVLLADTVTYNTNTDVATARGNVALVEPSGEVMFGEYVEITSDMKEAFVRDVRILLLDDTRIAADTAVRTSGNRTVFRQGVFSPCLPCEEDPDAAPLWQIKADRAIHDQEAQEMRYRNARLEFFGVPAFYTPYFSHADWTVDRKSGLLASEYGSEDFLGMYGKVPYYWVTGPTSDVTITPMYTQNQGLQLSTEFRKIFENGTLEATLSGTRADRIDSHGVLHEDQFRGHIDAMGRFDFSDTWRGGFDIRRASDESYPKVYNVDLRDEEQLYESRLFAERLEGRNYFSANAFAYQSLTDLVSTSRQPIVAPMLDWNHVSEPVWGSGYYELDANLLSLQREKGREVRRLSLSTAWNQPFMGPIGDVYTLRASLRTDGYWTDDHYPGTTAFDPQPSEGSDFTGRVFPQLSMEWRYPWVAQSEYFQQTFEPIVQAVAAPSFGNNDDIPNEDSLDVEFDDTNLFALNRFAGLDRVDKGSRIDFGMNYSFSTYSQFYSEAFIGKSYRFEENEDFSEGTGLRSKNSDYVGRVRIQPFRELDLLYRFRLDQEDLGFRQQEARFRAGIPEFRVTGSYLNFKETTESSRYGAREQVRISLSSQFTDHWRGRIYAQHDFENDYTPRAGANLIYEDECCTLYMGFERRRFRNREIQPEDTFGIRLSLKYLGAFGAEQGVGGRQSE